MIGSWEDPRKVFGAAMCALGELSGLEQRVVGIGAELGVHTQVLQIGLGQPHSHNIWHPANAQL